MVPHVLSAPILLRFPLHRRRSRVLHFELIRRAAGAVSKSDIARPRHSPTLQKYPRQAVRIVRGEAEGDFAWHDHPREVSPAMTRIRTKRGLSLVLGLAAAILAVGAAPRTADAQQDDVNLCNSQGEDLDAAIQACTRLLEPGRSASVASVFNARGLIWLRKGEHDRAIRDFDETINRDPKNAFAYRYRGIAWFQKDEFDRAILEYNKAIEIDKAPASVASAYKLRGIALSEKGEFERAITDYDRSIKLDASSFSTFKYRGDTWLRKRNYELALADFNQAIKLSPKDPDRYNDRAQVWLNKGDFKRALADYDEAIRLNPNNWRPYSSRGEARRLQGDFDLALADHNEAIRLDPKSADAYNNRALVYRDKGDFDAAIADYDEAILLRPTDARAFGNRGEIWRLKNDIARSLKDLDKAISLVPKSAMLRCRRGDTLREIGESDRALADFNEAILISPNSICAYSGRGQTFEAISDFARAKIDFEKAMALSLQKDPDFDTAKTAQETARTRLPIVTSLLKPPPAAASPELASTTTKVDRGVRKALVIGNSSYKSAAVLPNPRNDAEAIADVFRRIGFKSVRLEYDLDREKLTNALRAFARESASADWAVVYYAGHGIEVAGVNYLVPIDAKLETDRDVEFETVPLDRVMTAVDGAKQLRLIILDACRDNPFVRTMTRSVDRTRSIGRGLAKVEPDSGNLIIYSAKHGQVALDGRDGTRNSPFVTALIKNLQNPGIEIRKLFDLVRDDVMEATKRSQQPFTYGSVPGSQDFYFVAK
jgi:tetratricopeptide (TPR) repeat protein